MFKALPTLAVLLACTWFFSVPLHAMEIQKFDKMAGKDQEDYIVSLIEGAQKGLIDQGQNDLAAKVHNLFTKVLPGDSMPVGTAEFEMNLAQARLIDLERIQKNPNATRLEVEHAMIVTLKKNGILLPKRFMTVGKDFKPKHPPK